MPWRSAKLRWRSASRRLPRAIRHRFSRNCRNWWSGQVTAARQGGSITAFYTVLTEGDDQQDPIADSARAILDGHVVLSRALADQGHYPAIDIEASISRAMTELISPQQLELVRRFKMLYSRYHRSRDLISVGAYVKGGDPLLDEAIAMYPRLEAFLQQSMKQKVDAQESVVQLAQLLGQ